MSKKIVKNSKKTQFSATNQPKKNGRKPNKYKKLIKEAELSSSDISNVIGDIMQCTETELKDMIKDDKLPFSIRVFIRAIFTDMQDGDLRNISLLMDRSVGKVTDKMEHTGELSVNINIVPAGGKK